MLKYRLIFGALMIVAFTGLLLIDGWLDGAITVSPDDDRPFQGLILGVLICLIQIPAHLELAALAKAKSLRIGLPVSVIGSLLLATAWYWHSCLPFSFGQCEMLILALVLPALFFYHAHRFGLEGVMGGVGAAYLSMIYLGVLSGFLAGIRIEHGLWSLLMAIFVVKSSDIGAYTLGRLFGKHRFSPRISPGKTWEGMLGAVIFAIIVANIFADQGKIMTWPLATLFGVCFAFIGQMGDLVESMLKRDAQTKDSSTRIPGFGGVLDVLDSPLVAAPFAYLFFHLSAGMPS
jgi:phosphatidate cytidylyltransferase